MNETVAAECEGLCQGSGTGQIAVGTLLMLFGGEILIGFFISRRIDTSYLSSRA